MRRTTPDVTAMALALGSGQELLVVDDDPGVVELLQTTLTLAGYAVRVVRTGVEALSSYDACRPALVVLDVMLPGMDGFAICRAIQERGGRPAVLFLTARDAVEDRVAGLTLGADDYLTKPFSVPELLARVHALLRRSTPAEVEASPTPALQISDLTMDDRTRRVRRGNHQLALSRTEYTLLRYLLVNVDQVISKSQIMEHVWQHHFDDGVVEKLVSRLRAKVDVHPPPLIHTVRGFGYSLRLPTGG